MNARSMLVIKRCAAGLLLTAGLGGCAVYGPPYAGYDPYYGGAAYPAYVGPPVEFNLGLGFYDGPRHRGHYGGHGGWRGSGWSGHGGYHGGGGWQRGRGRGH
jgi:uncharacterized membrane protein YgcG